MGRKVVLALAYAVAFLIALIVPLVVSHTFAQLAEEYYSHEALSFWSISEREMDMHFSWYPGLLALLLNLFLVATIFSGLATGIDAFFSRYQSTRWRKAERKAKLEARRAKAKRATTN